PPAGRFGTGVWTSPIVTGKDAVSAGIVGRSDFGPSVMRRSSEDEGTGSRKPCEARSEPSGWNLARIPRQKRPGQDASAGRGAVLRQARVRHLLTYGTMRHMSDPAGSHLFSWKVRETASAAIHARARFALIHGTRLRRRR